MRVVANKVGKPTAHAALPSESLSKLLMMKPFADDFRT